MFVWPKMGCVWLKTGLIGQIDGCHPENYFKPSTNSIGNVLG